MSLSEWLRPRRRLWAMYNELGYIPWHKPRRAKARRRRKGVYMGTREAFIPFMNDDAKRTFSHLLLRPGYMMRDYILRGQHERYLAPITAMLVFYSLFTLIVAVVQPGEKESFGDALVRGFSDVTMVTDSTTVIDKSDLDDIHDITLHFADDDEQRTRRLKEIAESVLGTMREAFLLTRLDKHPEAANTPWKESLAAIEGDLRSKGVTLFLGNFLLLWMSMAILLRRRGISVSGAAAASGYVLCQYCIFMFLALLLSFGRDTDLGLLLMAVLLYIDYRQMLGLARKPTLKLTVKTGILYLVFQVTFYLLIGTGLVVFALFRMT